MSTIVENVPIVGILLAAGAGSRFGGDKLLARLPDGTPMGQASARVFCVALGRVVAAVRPDDPVLAALLRGEGLEVVECARAHLGMGESLACAVRAAPGAAGWIVGLADMPLVRESTVRQVADALAAGAAIVAPVHRGARGHPVGFSARFFERLAALGGDEGARAIVKAHAAEVVLVECDDPGVVADVDTRVELDRIVSNGR